MDIENFLISYMIDVYEQYCYYALEMSQDEFDQSFIDEEGQEISDRDYLIEHYDSILNEETLDELYNIICDPGDGKDISLRRLVSFFAGTYFIYNYYDGKNNLVRFIKDTPIEKIEDLFVENYDFGVDMVRSYFLGLVDRDRCAKNLTKINENGDKNIVDGLFGRAILTEYITLNDLLRKVICDLYNFYIENGYGDEDALSTTWQYFTINFDPIGTLDNLGIDVESKETYKKYMLGLIYADLYEDAVNTPIIDSENYDDRLADVVPIVATTLGFIRIPQDEDLRNRMLKHFILLQDEIEKRKDNREKTYKDNRINVLKKVNPLFQLDELTFNKN